MKLEIKKKILEDLLSKAVRLVGKHLTLPVLSCVYLDLDSSGNLIIKSTNIDLGLEINLKVKYSEPGTLAVPGNVFLNTVSTMHDESIVLTSDGNNLKIGSGKNSAVIKCMPHEDFPSIPRIQGTKVINIGAEDFVAGLKSVWYSASTSSIKPELASVYIYQAEDTLVFVSTDSFRLAERRVHAKGVSDFPPTLLPQKNVGELIKIFETYKGQLNITFDKNQASFQMGDIYLISRLIDGSFPDYKQIIPKDFVAKVTILKSDLATSIKASNVFSDSLNQVKLRVNKKDKSLEVESKNNDVGEYKEALKANVEGEGLELNFNNRYITESFQSIPSESLTLEFGGMGKPLIIKGASDKSFLYIAMPMNR